MFLRKFSTALALIFGALLSLAANALAGSLAQVGAQLGGPGVTAQDPACFYLDNGTNQVQCEMTARLCR